MRELTDTEKKEMKKMSEDILQNETVLVKDVFSRLLIGDPHLIFLRMQIIKTVIEATEKKLNEDLSADIREILRLLSSSVKVVNKEEVEKYLKDPRFKAVGVGVLSEIEDEKTVKKDKAVGRDMFG